MLGAIGPSKAAVDIRGSLDTTRVRLSPLGTITYKSYKSANTAEPMRYIDGRA